MFEGPEGDEADFLAKRGGFKFCGGDAGMESEAPADFIGHPVPNSGTGVLIQEEGFEWLFRMALDELADAGQGEFGVLGLRREVGPWVFAIVEHDAAEHAVVVKHEGCFGRAENEVIVLLHFVIGRRGGELAGHAEVDFEVEFGTKGKEHALAMGFG